MIYRLDIIKNLTTGTYRVVLFSDNAGTLADVATAKSPTKPRIAQIRAFLAAKGFEAYGDMRQIGDRTLRTMVRPV